MNKTAISWAPVPNWSGFSVATDGVIRGPSGKILRPMEADSGHLYVLHRLGGRGGPMRKLWVHRAVLTAFRGACPEGMEGRHLNGRPADNRITNLAWGTRYDQREDDRRNGVVRLPKGLILDQRQATTIRRMHGHVSSREAAMAFGVSHTTILKIWRGHRWVQRT